MRRMRTALYSHFISIFGGGLSIDLCLELTNYNPAKFTMDTLKTALAEKRTLCNGHFDGIAQFITYDSGGGNFLVQVFTADGSSTTKTLVSTAVMVDKVRPI